MLTVSARSRKRRFGILAALEKSLLKDNISGVTASGVAGVRSYIGPCVGCTVYLNLNNIGDLNLGFGALNPYKYYRPTYKVKLLKEDMERLTQGLHAYSFFSIPAEEIQETSFVSSIHAKDAISGSYDALRRDLKLRNITTPDLSLFSQKPGFKPDIEAAVVDQGYKSSVALYLATALAIIKYRLNLIEIEEELIRQGIDPSIYFISTTAGNAVLNLSPIIRDNLIKHGFTKYHRAILRKVIADYRNCSTLTEVLSGQ